MSKKLVEIMKTLLIGVILFLSIYIFSSFIVWDFADEQVLFLSRAGSAIYVVLILIISIFYDLGKEEDND